MDLNIDLLRTFVAVAETRSFTRSAKRMHRVQSAVSMQVKRLEELIGHRLLVRTRRSVELTAEGELMLGYARRILRLNEEALAEIRQSAVSGAVRLGFTDTCTSFLPGLLSRFAQTHPFIQLEVVCDRSWHLLDALDRGELDLALVTQHNSRPGGLVVREEPLVWACSPSHLPGQEHPVPLALFSEPCIYRREALRALEAVERPWRITYNSPSVASVEAAALAGLAVAVLPLSALSKGLAVLDEARGFPPLPSFEVTLFHQPGEVAGQVEVLMRDVAENLNRPGHSGADPFYTIAVGGMGR